MLAIVNCQHFPCQNCEMINSPKFYPAKYLAIWYFQSSYLIHLVTWCLLGIQAITIASKLSKDIVRLSYKQHPHSEACAICLTTDCIHALNQDSNEEAPRIVHSSPYMPISKPVPNSISTNSSATIGSRRSQNGCFTCLPIKCYSNQKYTYTNNYKNYIIKEIHDFLQEILKFVVTALHTYCLLRSEYLSDLQQHLCPQALSQYELLRQLSLLQL